MELTDEKFSVLSNAAAMAAGLVMHKLLGFGYKRSVGEDPPKNPAAKEVGWKQALFWSAAAGAIVGIARTSARRGAAMGWEKLGGELKDSQ